MARKPTYEELEQSLKELRGEVLKREHVEKELLVTMGRLQHVLTSNPAVIYTCEPGGYYGGTFVSENVKGQLGYEPQEFVDDPMFWANHVHPEDRSRVFDGLSQLFEKGLQSHEYRFQHNDGTYRWLRDELRLVLDGEGHPVEIVGYWINIGKRKQAEEALRESEANLSKAQQMTHIGNWAWNIVTNKISWSDELYRIVDLSPQQFSANYEAYLQCIHPDDLESFENIIKKVLRDKKPYAAEYRIVRPNGDVRTVRELGEVAVDANGDPINLFGTVQDLTERKHEEEQYRIIIQTAIDGFWINDNKRTHS